LAPQYDPRLAASERDSGIRKISRLTRRAGLAGVACSAPIGLALGHHQQAASDVHQEQHQPGGIIIPGQPPQPASGSGQVNSGGS
jgi:hypothetical protein